MAKKLIGFGLGSLLALTSLAFAENLQCPSAVKSHLLVKQKVSVLSQTTILECYYSAAVLSRKDCATFGENWGVLEGLDETIYWCEGRSDYEPPKTTDGVPINTMKQFIEGQP